MKSERPPYWRMIREAIDQLGGRARYDDIRDHLRLHYDDINDLTLRTQIAICTVNSRSRVHYPENHKPRLANAQWDFLFKVERGVVVRYDPQQHGLWELRRGADGKMEVGRVEAAADALSGTGVNGAERKAAPMPWAELLTRYGFPVDATEEGTFQVHAPQTVDLDLLVRILRRMGHPDALDLASLCLRFEGAGDESEFASTYRALCRRGDSYVEPGIAGLVQVFREIGLTTVQSCEGHLPGEGSRQPTRPYIQFGSGVAGLQALALVQVASKALEHGPALELNGDWLSIGCKHAANDAGFIRQRQFLLDAATLLRANLLHARDAAQRVYEGYHLLWEPIDDLLA